MANPKLAVMPEIHDDVFWYNINKTTKLYTLPTCKHMVNHIREKVMECAFKFACNFQWPKIKLGQCLHIQIGKSVHDTSDMLASTTIINSLHCHILIEKLMSLLRINNKGINTV
jgi:hypothetical protein